jgi:hypothetical protein
MGEGGSLVGDLSGYDGNFCPLETFCPGCCAWQERYAGQKRFFSLKRRRKRV